MTVPSTLPFFHFEDIELEYGDLWNVALEPMPGMYCSSSDNSSGAVEGHVFLQYHCATAISSAFFQLTPLTIVPLSMGILVTLVLVLLLTWWLPRKGTLAIKEYMKQVQANRFEWGTVDKNGQLTLRYYSPCKLPILRVEAMITTVRNSINDSGSHKK